MMGAPRLGEEDVSLITSYLKTNMPAALGRVRADRLDPSVNTEVPRTYLTIEGAKGYQAPVIWVRFESFDFKLSENKANFIAGMSRIYVNALVEDRDPTLLLKKVERYNSALVDLLYNAQLTSTDSRVKITVTIKSVSHSPHFSKATDPTIPEGVFRKELAMECEVEHWEDF